MPRRNHIERLVTSRTMVDKLNESIDKLNELRSYKEFLKTRKVWFIRDINRIEAVLLQILEIMQGRTAKDADEDFESYIKQLTIEVNNADS